MRVYFVRHGESEENTTNIYRGPSAKLTETGYEQARFVAERFATIPVDLIISSTMLRAKETARVIAERVGQGVTYSDLLIESDAPSGLLGKEFDDPEALRIRAEWLSVRFKDENMQYADEETVAALKARGKKALDFIAHQHADDCLVVTHSTFLRVLLGIMIEGDAFSPQTFLNLRTALSLSNTGITVCEYGPLPFRNDIIASMLPGGGDASAPRWRLITWNDHAHLG